MGTRRFGAGDTEPGLGEGRGLGDTGPGNWAAGNGEIGFVSSDSWGAGNWGLPGGRRPESGVGSGGAGWASTGSAGGNTCSTACGIGFVSPDAKRQEAGDGRQELGAKG